MNDIKNKKYNRIIIVVSILIPIVVAVLSRVRIPNVPSLDILPPIYATINGATAILLVVAVMQIKRGNRRKHQVLMKINLFLSLLFLIMYIAYHVTSKSLDAYKAAFKHWHTCPPLTKWKILLGFIAIFFYKIK